MPQQRSITVDQPLVEAVRSPDVPFQRDPATRMAYWLVGYFAFIQGALGLIMPFLRAELRLDYTIASLHFSAFALGAVASGVITDRALARWNRGRVLWTALAGMGVWTLLLLVAPTPALTIPAALLMGTFGNVALISLQALLSDRHGHWRTTALAEANVAASLASILASVVVGAITSIGLGWRFSLLLPIVVLIIVRWRYSAVAVGDASSRGYAGRLKRARCLDATG